MNDKTPIFIRENITYLRKKEGLTQADLGKILKKTTIAVSNFENGKRDPTIYDVIILAERFDVRLDYFLYTKLEEIDYKDFIKDDKHKFSANVIKTEAEKKSDLDELMMDLEKIKQKIKEIE